jgi:hypothetical protein
MQLLKILALGLALGLGSNAAHAKEADPEKAAELKMAVRDLWVGHIFWVRNVAVNEWAKKKGALDVADKKAVENARAIADAIGGFYGKEAGDQMFKLLAGHYGAIRKHMKATFKKEKKDKKGQDKAIKEALANVDEIAAFLSGANPNLPKETLKSVLTTHGTHHFGQNEAIRKGDWKGEAEIWDHMRTHMLDVADVLAGAIAKQFPEKFQQE